MKADCRTLLVLALVLSASAQADQQPFGPNNSQVTVSVKYAVLGKYVASFEDYHGVLDYDAKAGVVRSVYLKIKAATIKSGFANNDGIVRSAQLLDVNKFPDIIFETQQISSTPNGFVVDGLLQMHGISRPVQFPFHEKLLRFRRGILLLQCSGRWVVARKEFGVIWNQLLDHGGILVGNDITFDWQINVPIRQES